MADKGGQQPFTSRFGQAILPPRARSAKPGPRAIWSGCARLRQHVPLLACQLQLGTALGFSCVALALFTFESIKLLPKLTEYVLEIIEGFIDFFSDGSSSFRSGAGRSGDGMSGTAACAVTDLLPRVGVQLVLQRLASSSISRHVHRPSCCANRHDARFGIRRTNHSPPGSSRIGPALLPDNALAAQAQRGSKNRIAMKSAHGYLH